MRKGKLLKYAEVREFPNVIECKLKHTSPVTLTSTWDNPFRNKEQPITLELGCGRGEYTLNLARTYPERNFIGIDIKGVRIWHGASAALQENLENVLFVRMSIEFLGAFFPENSVTEIWVTFPDPIHKQAWKKSAKRLTSPRFLEMYKKILTSEGCIHLKTDDDILYHFSRESAIETGAHIINDTNDLYKSSINNDAILVKTAFEKRFLAQNKAIKYLSLSY